MFNTSVNRVRQPGEINSGELLVETAGYVSRERKIKSMIAAGKRLELMRKAGMFDVPEDIEVDISDLSLNPIREKSFDLSDASEIVEKGKIAKSKIEELTKISRKNEAYKKYQKMVEEERLKKIEASKAQDVKLTPPDSVGEV